MTTEDKEAIVEHLSEHLRNNTVNLTPLERLIKRGWLGIISVGDVHTIYLMRAGQQALESFLIEQEEMEAATKNNGVSVEPRVPWKQRKDMEA